MNSELGQLTPLLQSVRDWSFQREEAIDPAIQSYTGGRLAKDLMLRLRTVNFPQFNAGLTLLAHPFEAMAVDVLLRSLLEALAQATWIGEGEAKSTSKPKDACLGTDTDGVGMDQRALCLEYGIAKQFAENVHQGHPSSMDQSTPSRADAWLDVSEKEHAATGCSGRGRGYRDVSRTLVDFGDRMSLTWPIDLWRVTSGVGHQMMPHRFAQDVNGITVWGKPLPVEELLKILDRLTKIFANFYQYVVLVMAPGDLQSFQRSFSMISAQIHDAYKKLGLLD